MWFIILIIGAIFLGFIISISINPKKTPIVRTKKRSEPQLLSDQIDKRLGIKQNNKPTKNTSTQPHYTKAEKLAILEVEFPNYKRILEESVQLIQTTSNLETLLSRYNIALEHYHWIMERKNNGLPIYFNTEDGGFENALNKINNYHIVRIAMDTFINYKVKMLGLKTIKAKDNNTAKMFEFLGRCKESLKTHENRIEYESKLDKLHNNTEDFYSDNISN